MTRQSLRFLAPLGLTLVCAALSGCLVKGPAQQPEYYPYVRIQPDYNLETLPAGWVYNLWVADTVTRDSSVTVGRLKSLARFKWDQSLYLAKSVNDTILSLTAAPGIDVGINTMDFLVAFLTVERETSQNPNLPSGPVLLVGNINKDAHTAPMVSPFPLLPLLLMEPASASYTLISQSNKKAHPGSKWRDSTRTEGQGIWFTTPTVAEKVVIDPLVTYEAYQKVIIPPSGPPYQYTIWIYTPHNGQPAHPDSSFSNFGRVLGITDTMVKPPIIAQEPDLRFLNGVPLHSPDRTGPRIYPWEDSIIIDGRTVGYVYISDDGKDTCRLRVDRPELTRCNTDPFDSLTFDKQSTTRREFRVTGGDTTMSPTIHMARLDSLPPILYQIGLASLLGGWEYEAWLVFDRNSGVTPRFLSLGRFVNPRGPDRSNPYTNPPPDFDRNFHFPGEDFVRNMPSGLPTPFNVINDTRASKVWITVEPIAPLDWAPNDPNAQLIYFSQWIPHSLSDSASATVPMAPLDPNPGLESLNEGHHFPYVNVILSKPPE